MVPTISLIALLLAAIASAHCNHPQLLHKHQTWAFKFYEAPNCEATKNKSATDYYPDTHHSPVKGGKCWNVATTIHPIMSASYYGLDDNMRGYSEHDCKGDQLFEAKRYSESHFFGWFHDTYYAWASDHFSKKQQGLKSFRGGSFHLEV
ncbi:hypothetical protein BJ138DRAFT_1153703 [Hygrophoropsis aurantiaca]|uniref:Uncharacterized protein n=1 Tax=Hygrophoropsis aurantiaca TaxID=72124 RepID=A0ACB8A9G0_9AGAM|nr:hypothetical protein BJ138DRAFT_1153703 [Hygrophoropsis aurantiaca]